MEGIARAIYAQYISDLASPNFSQTLQIDEEPCVFPPIASIQIINLLFYCIFELTATSIPVKVVLIEFSR